VSAGNDVRNNATITVLVMAGGTGGHVFPALAVAERLRAEGVTIAWMGTPDHLEAELVPGAGFDFHAVPVPALRGKGAWRLLWAPFALLRSIAAAFGAVRRIAPDLVLGMGGYAAGPGGVAAWLLGRPLVVHEQNSVPGVTNRMLARLATRVLEAFPGSFPRGRGARHTGNPVREDVAAIAPPHERLAGRRGPLRLLVLGGSQGARVLNEIVPVAIGALADPGIVEIRHQAGTRHVDDTRERYARAGVDVTPVGFIEDMAAAYGWADLVVCRAGAMTIAELACAGAASILVPFPHAVDDHQTKNARYLADARAAILVPQSELDPPRLGGLLAELHAARDRLLEMALAARRLAVPDAAQRVADCCRELAHA